MAKLDQSLVVGEHQMITPAGSIDDAIMQFQLYQQLKTSLATEDDFQAIGKNKHPKKSFVRKVQRFFNLSCELLRDEPLRDENSKIIAWLATARAMHIPTGAFQDADGSCSFDEKVDIQKTIHNIRAHAITRAKNRAILDLVGFGDVSAEEMATGENHSARSYTQNVDNPSDVVMTFGKHKDEKLGDIPRDYIEWLAENARDEWLKDAANAVLSQPLQGQKTIDEFTVNDEADLPPEFGLPVDAMSNNNGFATDNQIKAIYAAAKNIDLNNEEAKQWASDVIKRDISSMKELTKSEASSVISELNQISKAK